MLDKLLGSKTAQKIFLHLYHYGESYPSAVAKDFKISLGQVQRQFDRFEDAGIIISKLSGRTRMYQFNKKQGIVKYIGVIYIVQVPVGIVYLKIDYQNYVCYMQ